MQLIAFIRAIRTALFLLCGSELATVSMLAYHLFNICLLSISLLLPFLLMKSIQFLVEAFDEQLGLTSFAKRHRSYLLILKVTTIGTVLGGIFVHHWLNGEGIERLGAEVWVVLCSEVASSLLVLLKEHTQRLRNIRVRLQINKYKSQTKESLAFVFINLQSDPDIFFPKT